LSVQIKFDLIPDWLPIQLKEEETVLKKTLHKKFRNRIWIRSVIQAFFFVLIALIAVNHTLAEAGGGIPLLASASLHALCPFGGVVSIYQYAVAGSFVQKIHESSFVLMVIGSDRFSAAGCVPLALSRNGWPAWGVNC
jgi:hypothetical protein